MADLVLPLTADALWLEHAESVLGATSDPSILPRRGDDRDHYGGTPNLAAAITVEPFAESTHRLEPGVHLHWSLPQALTRGSTRSGPSHAIEVDGLHLPAAPNRWLVVRTDGRWRARIESDFVHPASAGRPPHATLYPAHGDDRRHRFVGRQLTSGAESENDDVDAALDAALDDEFPRYLDPPLTALGPGDPMFAALYGNCRSVFGAYDDLTDFDGSGAPSYEIFGWYEDPPVPPTLTALTALGASEGNRRADGDTDPGVPQPASIDPLGQLTLEMAGPTVVVARSPGGDRNTVYRRQADGSWTETNELGAGAFTERERTTDRVVLWSEPRNVRLDIDLAIGQVGYWDANLPSERSVYLYDIVSVYPDDRRTIEERFGCDLAGMNSPTRPGLPNRIVCHGRVTAAAPADTATATFDAKVAVGSTATEALAAWLAADVASGDRDAGQVHPLAGLTERPDASDLEDLVEGLGFPELWDEHHVDARAAVRSLRHEQRFREVGRTTVWSIRRRRDATDDDGTTPLESLDPEIHELLAGVNEAMLELERRRFVVESQRQRAFDDWHAFMEAAYPEIETGTAVVDLDDLSDLVVASLEPLHEPGLAQLFQELGGIPRPLVSAVRRLQRVLGVHRDLEVVRATGPRFWRPRDPVVLIGGAGDVTRASDRHRAPDDLVARVVDGDTIGDLRRGVTPSSLVTGPAAPAQRVVAGRPWHPLFLEWAVEVRPVAAGSNLDGADRRYSPDVIADHYAPEADGPELELVDDADLAGGFRQLTGRTMLSDHGPVVVQQRIDELLDRLATNLLPTADTAVRGPSADRDVATRKLVALDPRIAEIVALRDHLDTAPELSQSLGGFHDGLLMQASIRQLPIDDPLGFRAQRDLAAAIGRVVDGRRMRSPLHDHPFHPIRTGEMVISRLRLVDTFGQAREWRPSSVVGADGYRVADGGQRVRLAPRFSQPARLNLRWLSSVAPSRDADESPVTTPILGWLVPNDLDDVIQVHDADGAMLGSVDAGKWRSRPGDPAPVLSTAGIAQPALRRVVEWITESERPAATMRSMLASFEQSLAAIAPSDHANLAAHVDLVGRPIALVRAQMSLELLGLPADDLSWEAIRARTQGHPRDDHGFGGVRVPVRIGDSGRWNDGVVGYWIEQPGGLDDRFVSPHLDGGVDRAALAPASTFDAPGAGTRRGAHHTVWQALDDPPIELSVLLDPRGALHAACGMLPTKAITVPTSQVAPAVRRIDAMFRVMPLLTPADAIAVPSPVETDHTWTWLQRHGEAWSESSPPAPAPANGDEPVDHPASGGMVATSTGPRFGVATVVRDGYLHRRVKQDRT